MTLRVEIPHHGTPRVSVVELLGLPLEIIGQAIYCESERRTVLRLELGGGKPMDDDFESCCHAGRDGDCNWTHCPQERDGRVDYLPLCPLAHIPAVAMIQSLQSRSAPSSDTEHYLAPARARGAGADALALAARIREYLPEPAPELHAALDALVSLAVRRATAPPGATPEQMHERYKAALKEAWYSDPRSEHYDGKIDRAERLALAKVCAAPPGATPAGGDARCPTCDGDLSPVAGGMSLCTACATPATPMERVRGLNSRVRSLQQEIRRLTWRDS